MTSVGNTEAGWINSARSDKNLEIQSLRGYAILITVIAHLGPIAPPLIPYLAYFWLGGGVDLFFCISGFVIARSLFQAQREQLSAFYWPFLIRRMFRLWPAAIFWSLAVLLFTLFVNERGSFGDFRGNLAMAVASWIQVVNLKLVACLQYDLVSCARASPLRIYWSLSLEEQFYFVFPLILFVLGNRKIAMLAAVLALGQMFLYRPWPSALWFFRTDAICLGVLIAWLHMNGFARRAEPRFLESDSLRMIVSVALCALLFLVARPDVAFFFNGLVALVGAALVYVASFDKGYFLKPGLMLRCSAFVGERSYSIYLTHLVGIVLVRELHVRFYGVLPKDSLSLACLVLLAIALILLMSEFSYQVVELPLRNKGRVIAARSWTATTSVKPIEIGK